MTILEEVKEEFKSRMSNPLIGSFLIAFLIFNWYTLLTLLFYKQSELHLDGNYKTYKDVIYSQINIWRNLAFPLIAALVYVIIMPYIKGKVQDYQEGVSIKFKNRITLHNRKLLNIAEENEQLAESNRVLNITLNKKEDALVDSASNINKQTLKIQELESRIDRENKINTALIGLWLVKIEDDDGTTIWNISNSFIKQRYANIEREIYTISTFVGFGDKIMFKLITPGGKRTLLELDWHNASRDVFDGFIDFTTDIRLTKFKPPAEIKN